jgi:hypothetical protein
LRQDFFENLGNFSRDRWPRWFVPTKLKLNGSVLPVVGEDATTAGLAFNNEEEEEEGLLPPALPEVPAYKK